MSGACTLLTKVVLDFLLATKTSNCWAGLVLRGPSPNADSTRLQALDLILSPSLLLKYG